MSEPTALRGVPLTKGHATENDFVLLADPDDALDLDAATVAALCDRRSGIGADGLVRAVRSTRTTTGEDAAEWFMDYRNADGSLAEMCGNALRLLAAYLEAEGFLDLSDGAPVRVGTRGGVRTVWRSGSDYTVDMGPWQVPGGEDAVRRGFDVAVQVAGLEGTRAGLQVAMPNPHTVVALPDTAELDGLDLGPQVAVDPPPVEGTNVELVVPLGETTTDGEVVGTVRMRVQERGVGETRSCGTGACAVAVALHAWGGAQAPRLWRVLLPGGELLVRLTDDGRALLTGPATLVAQVVLR
ncbi:diaminopimelate epimerase [Georgenia sp. H159]|uniref:diaminopimelate epimerase n=1 Tax=Georgenia sp. H159 TaxID=3076115 RepID=UPI002D76DC5A|nr:diaminopimelate epimerase [Georgenia sp. H159]